MAEGEGEGGRRVQAEFSDYAGMLAAIRARVKELQVNGERFDEYAGLPRGYLSKLVGARPTRRVGMQSFSPLMNALALRCLFVIDEEAERRLKERLQPRNGSYVRPTYTHLTITNRKWAQIQKLGRQVRWRRLSKKQRSEFMRALALKRWRNGHR